MRKRSKLINKILLKEKLKKDIIGKKITINNAGFYTNGDIGMRLSFILPKEYSKTFGNSSKPIEINILDSKCKLLFFNKNIVNIVTNDLSMFKKIIHYFNIDFNLIDFKNLIINRPNYLNQINSLNLSVKNIDKVLEEFNYEFA